jgi:hypothetical protein
MVRERTDAIIVQPSLPTKRVAELALGHRIPAVHGYRRAIAVESHLKLRFSSFVDRARTEAKSNPTHPFATRVSKTCDLRLAHARLADTHPRG